MRIVIPAMHGDRGCVCAEERGMQDSAATISTRTDWRPKR